MLFDAIRAVAETNQLRAEWVGDGHTFIDNGVPIIQVRDSVLTSGQTGFVATPPFELQNVLP